MRHRLLFPLLVLALTATAAADVTYTFTGTPFGINEPQSFTVTPPDYISGVTKFLAANLASCTGSLTCVSVTFDPNAPDAGLLAPADEILFEAENGVWNFFFPDFAFVASGEYDNLGPTGNIGHLSITATAVPEPMTLFLMGVGGLGVVAARRRSRAARA